MTERQRDAVTTKKPMWDSVLHAGIATFLHKPIVAPRREELHKANATVAILGMPFDSTTITRTGSMHGPRAVRDASSQFLPYHYGYRTNLDEFEVIVDCGDVSAVPGSPEITFGRAAEVLDQIYWAAAMPLLVGGDHSTTIPGTAAFSRALGGRRFGMIMFDTHLDTADHIGGVKLSHCAPITRTLELPNVEPHNVVIIGPHGAANPLEELEYVQAHGIRVYDASEVIDRGIDAVVHEALALVSKGTEALYLSVDLDSLDGAYVHGTCAPEPGGLTPRELLRAVYLIGVHGIDAMDVVEIAPQYDLGGIAPRTACRIMLDALVGNTKRARPQVFR
jgi:agmatinase